jgi:hypothetical protein
MFPFDDGVTDVRCCSFAWDGSRVDGTAGDWGACQGK